MVASLVGLLSLLATLLPATAAAAAPAVAADTAPAHVRVIATARDDLAWAPYAVTSRQPNMGTFTVDADGATLARMRRDPRIGGITLDRELHPALAESTAQIHADAAWSSGLTGAGQTIAVVDTGVDAGHPMLAGHVVDEACFTEATLGETGACPNGEPSQFGAGAADPCAGTGCDHGTHVASIAAGSAFGALRGVAPDATVLAVQVFTPTPTGPTTSISEVLAAFEWVYEQRDRFAIAAINLSVAAPAPTTTPCADDAVEQATLRLRAVGIAVLAAAGNGGSATDLAYPACVPGIISVGSVGPSSTPSAFGNRGPQLSLFAPGENVTAAAPGGGTQTRSGTSQATPHVAGALALFRQRQPSASFDSILALFDRTADAVVAPDGQRSGAGMLRIDRALDPRYQQPSVPFSRTAPPIAIVDSVQARPGFVDVVGSLVDPGSVLPAVVTALVDGRARSAVQTVPADGDRQRFALHVPVEGGVPIELCVDVRGARDDSGVSAGCTAVTPPGGPGIGSLDVAQAALGSLLVHGWAIDPDVSTPVEVHVYVDGVLATGTRADRTRDDVGRAYPDYGSSHGFTATIAVGGGQHVVCAYAIDATDDPNALVGCRPFEMRTGDPFGALDVVRASGAGIVVEGWAIDPDARTPIAVHLYVDGRLVRGATADRARGDVRAVFPQYPADHGYDITLVLSEGPHVVCVYGINEGPGVNALLGCRSI